MSILYATPFCYTAMRTWKTDVPKLQCGWLNINHAFLFNKAYPNFNFLARGTNLLKYTCVVYRLQSLLKCLITFVPQGVTKVQLAHIRVQVLVCLPSLIKNSSITFEAVRSSRMRKRILMKKVENFHCKRGGKSVLYHLFLF